MLRRRLLLTALVLALSQSGIAQQPTPTGEGARVRIVHAGHLLDHPGKPMRGASTLVVRDGRVVAVHDGLRDAAALGLPAETSVIDQSRRYVLPGLIDSHVHLRGDTGGIEGMVEGLTRSHAAGAFNALLMGQKTLRAGFTTVRNLGDGNGVTLALRDIAASGKLQAPRIVDAGSAISAVTRSAWPRIPTPTPARC